MYCLHTHSVGEVVGPPVVGNRVGLDVGKGVGRRVLGGKVGDSVSQLYPFFLHLR